MKSRRNKIVLAVIVWVAAFNIFGNLRSFQPAGQPSGNAPGWTYAVSKQYYDSNLMPSDSGILLRTRDKIVLLDESSGRSKWIFHAPGDIIDVRQLPEGLAVACADGSINYLRDGKTIWAADTRGRIVDFILTKNGRLAVLSGKYLLEYQADSGKLSRKINLSDPFFSAQFVEMQNGNLFIVGPDTTTLVKPDGSTITTSVDGLVYDSSEQRPRVIGGSPYLMTYDSSLDFGCLQRVDPSTGKLVSVRKFKIPARIYDERLEYEDEYDEGNIPTSALISEDGIFYCIENVSDKIGQKLISLDLRKNIQSVNDCPVQEPSLCEYGGAVYLTTGSTIARLDASGRELWRVPREGTVTVGNLCEDTLCLASIQPPASRRRSLDYRISLLDNSTGETVWSRKTKDQVSALTLRNGRLFVLAGHKVQAFDVDPARFQEPSHTSGQASGD